MLDNNVEVFESDSDEEIVQYVERFRQPQRFRIRVDYMEDLEEWEFFMRFRLTKNTVREILQLIEDDIASPTDRNHAIKPITKLLLALRFYATGSMLLVVSDFAGVSESSACIIIKIVTESIARLRAAYIYMPQGEEKLQVQLRFYEIARFPKVIGAIDCTHVRIQSPGGDDAEYYRNRKGYFSWNVQVISDADFTIRNIVARWPGSSHDQTIFTNSNIKARFEAGEMGDSILLGDSGYGVTNYLIPPLLQPSTRAEALFNESQIRSRNKVECCFGIWKRRFPVLSLGMRVCLDRSKAIIVATAVLHNMAIKANEAEPPEDPDFVAQVEEGDPIDMNQVIQGNNTRRLSLINNYFGNLNN